MKKIISILLTATLLMSTISVFAENEETATVDETVTETAVEKISETAEESEATPESDTQTPQIDPALAKNQVTVTAVIADTPLIKESDATFELFTLDGKSLGTATSRIERDSKTVVFTFDIPTYQIGTHFKVRAVDGLESFIYYEDKYHTGTDITLPTYKYIDANGNEADSTDISITINPLHDKTINLYYNAISTPTNGARIIDGTAMVPARALAEFVGFDVRYDEEYNVEVLTFADKNIYFNVDTAYTTVFGTDLFAPHKTVMIDGTVYIALRTFADAIGSELEIKDYGTHMDINMSESALVSDYFNQFSVNKWGIASRTNYMVWVSLSEFKVRLYEGRQHHWKPILEAPCATGAPWTPTVTGSYEYNYKARWDYGTYYVGPCLVFYRGYALHSVLLNYNGTEYDGRVGVQISHGCIRMKKKDIDFIANTIPVGTRIYITP